ncbi:N-acetyltransferase ESCO2-like [Pollicipes pollicipes]|uniref:N-acetyltransferase ESCO2-like n=1 Tax=Pollicipes pollicipes TaxID=41117 RepID=UPI00188572C9|nr:N-acetyltransferase ESCO2-like [Pollicipes pollicipes]
MQMEAGEDKENEAPAGRKKDTQPRFYSIFYRKAGGQVETRGEVSPAQGTGPPARPASKSTRASALAGRQTGDGLEQLVIDAGQRQFGVITCSTCAVVYTIGDPEDEALHARHHTGYLGALAFPGWKREREVGHYMDGRVVMVTPRDAAHAWRKVDSVLRLVDAELGFVGVGVRNKEQSKVFFYVVERQIVGCLVAEPVTQGFAVLPRDDSTAVRCDTAARPCVAGVSRVWVHRDYRRRRLATRLLEAMRNHFALTPLGWPDVAFSDPTPDGLQFAAGATGSQQFLVYNQ